LDAGYEQSSVQDPWRGVDVQRVLPFLPFLWGFTVVKQRWSICDDVLLNAPIYRGIPATRKIHFSPQAKTTYRKLIHENLM
jgi:hypothetical protein